MNDCDKVLTLVVPAYNMEAYLAKCCNSVLVSPNLMRRLEVIIVNDGSKDATSKVAHRYAESYPETFSVIDKANGHYGSCVNAALKVAKGLYIKLLDADDTFDGASFEAHLRYLLSFEDLPDLVLTDAIRVDASGKQIQKHCCSLPERKTIAFADLPDHFISNIWAMWITYRTELLRSISYRQTEGVPFTDVQWGITPMALVRSVVYNPIVLYKYLIGREGQSIEKKFVFNNMFNAMAKVAFETLNQYKNISEQCSDHNARYIENHILDMFCCQ